MKTILVPTDFSEEAGYALNVAVAIAQPTKAKICLMHVLQSLYESAYAASADLPDDGWKRLEDRIEKAERQLLLTNSSCTVCKVKTRG